MTPSSTSTTGRRSRPRCCATALRTALTAFGVFWGIFLLMVMLGSGTGLRNGVIRGFAGRAPPTASSSGRSARSKPFRGMPAGRRMQLDNDDVHGDPRQGARGRHRGAAQPARRLHGRQQRHPRRARPAAFNVIGDYPEIRRIQSLPHGARGASSNPLDVADAAQGRGDRHPRARGAVRGGREADRRLDRDPRRLLPGGRRLRARCSRATRRSARRRRIFVPFTTFQRAFNFGDRVGWLAVTSQARRCRPRWSRSKVLELLRAAPQGGARRQPRLRPLQPRGGVREDPGPLRRHRHPGLDGRHRHAGRRRHRRLQHHADHRQGAHQGDRRPPRRRRAALGDRRRRSSSSR